MKTLKFDSKRLADDMCDMLIASADEIMEHFKHDAESKLKSTDFETIDAVYYEAQKIINAECIFHALSIMESYGTGSHMDMSNEYIQSYMESNLWNPARTGKEIVGRPKGEYINILGLEMYSKGRMEGKPIGNPGRKPTYAIQQAEQMLKDGGYIGRILKYNTDEFFSRLNASKYFVFN